MKAILKKHGYILQSDKKITHLFKEPPLVVYKRGRNIGDSLVRSDMPPEPTQTLSTPIPNGNYKCGSCAQCNSNTKMSFFRHPVRGIISCKTKGEIYLITCSCGKAHVDKGKTIKTNA
jgi:hypothetical protein